MNISARPPPGFDILNLSADPYLEHNGPLFTRIAPSGPEGGSPLVVGFRVLPRHANPGGVCHGGMLMSAMDIALGQAVLHAAPSQTFTPTMTMTHEFLRPAELGSWLESRIDLIHTTRRSGFANGVFVGSDGPIIRSSAVFRLG